MFWKLPLASEAQTGAESLIKASPSPSGSNETDKQNTPMYFKLMCTKLLCFEIRYGVSNFKVSALCVSLIMGLGNDSDKDDKDNDNEISSNQSFLIISSSNEMTMTTKYFGQSLRVMGPS